MPKMINDHKFWAGGKSKGSVFPEGVHHKMEESAEGAGKVMEYQDTTEAIKKAQMENDRKARSHHLKEGYRN